MSALLYSLSFDPQVLFGRQQKEASERKAAAVNAARDALAGVGQKAKRGEHGEHDGDVSQNKPLQMLQVWIVAADVVVVVGDSVCVVAVRETNVRLLRWWWEMCYHCLCLSAVLLAGCWCRCRCCF